MKDLPEEEIVLHGEPISQGIAIGFPFFFREIDEKIKEVFLPEEDIEKEIKRFRKALKSSQLDLENLQKSLMLDVDSEAAQIIESHLQMLRDPMMAEIVEKKIHNLQKNTESVFQLFIDEYKTRFSNVDSQERVVQDIVDVSHRVLKHLNALKRLDNVPLDSIVLAKELVPSDPMEASLRGVLAFVTEKGGTTAHDAIIAKSCGIPYVAQISMNLFQEQNLKTIIVDGIKGDVIINPTPRTIEKYKQLKQGLRSYYKHLKEEMFLPCQTMDSVPIKIMANVGNYSDVENLLQNRDIEGIGLFRSEYLFFSMRRIPSEEDQFALYKKIAKKLKDKPFIIRLFDVGADKNYAISSQLQEEKFSIFQGGLNPALGYRGIRFLLKNRDIFEMQLRAILRASIYGNIQILIPFVCDVSEIREVRKTIEKVEKELVARNVKIKKKILLGAMIEIPSSAIMSDVLAPEVDFLSVGTNDLIQYVLAIDRSSSSFNYIYKPTHPSILRLLKQVVHVAQKMGKSLILCGEIAGDPNYTKLLLGLGFNQFSVAPRNSLFIKHEVRKISMSEAKKIAKKVLNRKES